MKPDLMTIAKGLTSGYVPRFVKKYAELQQIISTAVAAYRDDVSDGSFPGDDQTFS